MGIHSRIKSAYLSLGHAVSNNRFSDYKWLLEQEVNTWSNWVPQPLHERTQLWQHGFTSPCGKLYDFDTHDPSSYLSELQRYRFYKSLNGNFRYQIDDKLTQHWMLSDHPDYRPQAFGFLDRGYVHGLAGTTFDGYPTPVAEWIPEVLQRRSKLVLKELRGQGGKQVHVCEFDDGYYLDSERQSEEDLTDSVAGLNGYIVTEYVHQHDYADALYPRSANTVRLLTIWDEEGGELLTPMAIHRIGTEKSSPVDNWSSGGLSAEIDLDTGHLAQAAQFPFSGEVSWYSTHPDTGSRIEGASVPNWNEVRSTIEQLALKNTHIPALGWDVIVNRVGEPVVIEANTGTDIDLLQVHRPLLTDSQVSRLVARHLPGVEPTD